MVTAITEKFITGIFVGRRTRQVWFIPSADKRVGVQVKLRSLDNALLYLSALEVGCLQ